MKHLFVPYDIAKLLWDKGCKLEAYFGGWDGNQKWYWHPDSDITLDAPLYQQVVDWFREKHKIKVEVRLYGNSFQQSYVPAIIEGLNPNRTKELQSFGDYYEALTEAINQALNIIQ
jgi:hypothetical protein